MKTVYGIGKLTKPIKNSILAIGVFDGVHIGHQNLIDYIVKQAKKKKSKAVVLTFSPHPVHVLRPEKFLPLIVPLERRLNLMEEYGVDVVVVARFSKKFSQMSPAKFIKRYIGEGIMPQEVVVGDDFKFGAGREGTLEFFKEEGVKYNFKVKPIGCLKNVDDKIGSTMIRNFITDGELKKAAKYLGRTFAIEGVVQKGFKRGAGLGFPTANIYPGDMLLPPDGAYAVCVTVGNKIYKGMANVGYCPTFRRGEPLKSVEINIFSFKQNIYNKKIKVEFIKYIRSEEVFASAEELKKQLEEDKVKSLKYLSKRSTK